MVQNCLYMPQKLIPAYAPVLDVCHYLPCITLIIPFEPKMTLKKELAYQLKIVSEKIESEIFGNYPREKALPVMKKLRQVIKDLNYNTHKISIAIFISPLIEKVYYLDLPVEEKIMIDDSFEIRDLIYSKKEIHKYLLVTLNHHWSRIYLGNTSKIIRLVSNVPNKRPAHIKDLPPKVSNGSDEKKEKEIRFNNVLKHTDNGLSLLLSSYKLPLLVMGNANAIGHFKTITQNSKRITGYVPFNFKKSTEPDLLKIMECYVADWKKIIQTDLMKQIAEAMGKEKLAIGIKEVWEVASQKRGKLLVVEMNFTYPAQQGTKEEIIFKQEEKMKNAFFIKDAVDDVIEKVLASGGDVEFVQEGLLMEYHRIVLIEHYRDE